MTSDLLSAMMASAATSARTRRAASAALVERDAVARQPDAAAFVTRLSSMSPAVIAECKRRSPSRGVLRVDYDAAAIAAAYEQAGAAAISVLTDGPFFDGSLDDLRAVRAAVTCPVLRKDFISDAYQLLEARAAGADAALLIVAGLSDLQLTSLLREASALGLATLVEVHDRDELHRALDAGSTVVGVNSRNLRTLDVNLHLHDQLAPDIPEHVTAVAESGLRTGADLRRLRGVGYDAFLVGERFMTVPHPGAALSELLAEARA